MSRRVTLFCGFWATALLVLISYLPMNVGLGLWALCMAFTAAVAALLGFFADLALDRYTAWEANERQREWDEMTQAMDRQVIGRRQW